MKKVVTAIFTILLFVSFSASAQILLKFPEGVNATKLALVLKSEANNIENLDITVTEIYKRNPYDLIVSSNVATPRPEKELIGWEIYLRAKKYYDYRISVPNDRISCWDTKNNRSCIPKFVSTVLSFQLDVSDDKIYEINFAFSGRIMNTASETYRYWYEEPMDNLISMLTEKLVELQ